MSATGGTASTVTIDGVERTLLTFTADGTLTVTEAALFDVVIQAGGQSGQGSKNGDGGAQTSGGQGGAHLSTKIWLEPGDYPVVVGAGGVGSNGYASVGQGSPSSLGVFVAANTGPEWTTSISGTPVTLASPGPNGIGTGYGNGPNAAPNTGNGGGGSAGGNPSEVHGGAGGSGIVQVLVPLAAPPVDAPAPDMSNGMWVKVYPPGDEFTPPPPDSTWAKITGGTVTEITEADGSVHEIHSFTASDSLVVEEAGVARVLVVGGGATGTGGSQWPPGGGGGGGGVLEMAVELSEGTVPVTVGASDQDSGFGPYNTGIWAKGGAGGAGGTANNGNPYGYILNWPPQAGAPAQYGGGGGAGGPAVGGVGGPGRATTIRGVEEVFGAGGNVGVNGHVPGDSGAPNTGNGGQGGRGENVNPRTPGSGGSGLVVVRVQKSAPTVSGVVATGGTVTEFTGDGVIGALGQKYRVHTFLSDGTLEVTQGGVFQALLVGGGGASRGWGGGGGGCVLEGDLHLSAGSYPVIVGAGGNSTEPAGRQSMLGTFRAGGGGVAWAETFGNSRLGGAGMYSGGGAFCSGGDCNPNNFTNAGGGGGGAGSAGTSGSSGVGGTAGNGLASTITGSTVYYGGGGAGCRTTSGQAHGGEGDAGTQGGTAAHTAGAANTGAGAGGQYNTSIAGGSGIVVVRYEIA